MSPSRPRIAAALLILALMAALAARLVPVYLDNLELQRSVEEMAQSAASRTQPDELLRIAVLQRAARLGLPVKADHVHIQRPDGRLRIEVRYVVKIDLPLYTVDLHFYPGAGSR
ncbi:MAG: DUF4845 domain-containing protein [Candidatus Solibacter usitatus]|nr:DUF4845 domain-containing protein [Candidatus Solibacter usitatus]